MIMKNILKKLIFFIPIFFCAFQCEIPPQITNISYIKNSTEDTVYILSNIWRDEIYQEFKPGDMIKWDEGCNDYAFPFMRGSIYNSTWTMKSKDGTILRRWTPENSKDLPKDRNTARAEGYATYFKGCIGVRVLHYEEDWTPCTISADTTIWTFEILPEDLIPLSEIIRFGS